jgi:hypothetical protein
MTMKGCEVFRRNLSDALSHGLEKSVRRQPILKGKSGALET